MPRMMKKGKDSLLNYSNVFEDMNFNNVRIYSMKFVKEEFKLIFDIDYILEWYLNKETNYFDKFLVASANLIFSNYHNLRIGIGQMQTFDLIIDQIEKRNYKGNSRMKLDEYSIILNCGSIKLIASHIELKLRSKPKISPFQELGSLDRK